MATKIGKNLMILDKTIDISPLADIRVALMDAITTAKSDLEKSGAIKHFELCYELTWKTLKRILGHRGIETNSPKETFRVAAAERLIDNVEKWYTFVELRNMTVHVYKHELAEEVFAALPNFIKEFEKLYKLLVTL